MGIARGRFVIDAHVHAQRHALGLERDKEKANYVNLMADMQRSSAYDNSPRLLYDMERYGVDMCVLMCGPGMGDKLNAEIIKKHPDRFVGLCCGRDYVDKCRRGETEWSIEGFCQALDELLSTGQWVGIGEGMPAGPVSFDKVQPWEERFDEICHIMEVAKKHKVVTGFHSGGPSGYGGGRHQLGRRAYSLEWVPELGHDIAAAYPDVPIIIVHGGMNGWWSEQIWERCLQVAAAHPNVYLETGMWWAELYEKPLRDPNIGVEKLIWGTDWGAAQPIQWWPGGYPTMYMDQSRKEGIPAHMTDIFGWSLRQLDKLDIPQDDLNLILGGNAARLYKIEDKLPHTRMFKQFLR